MTPNTYNFKPQTKGDTFSGIQFTFNTSTNDVETPIDLSGATIIMDIKKTYDSPVVKRLESTSGITITDAENGVVNINSFLVDLPAFKYVYDVEIVFPDTTVKTYIKGTFEVVGDVTDSTSTSLLSVGEFSTFKNISKKNDKDKIEQCIKLAQSVDLVDVLGDFYFDLINNINTSSYSDLINGSSFTIDGDDYTQAGIKSYLADLTYARYLYEINTNQTPFGLQQKFTNDSQPVDRNFIRDLVKQSQQDASIKFNMIDKYLQENNTTFSRYCKGNNPNINTFGQKFTVIK
ncbi:hypothetical protein [Psychroserpens mesophilus]|uniref:DUF6712 family protein n=1 Tax=Psychroserpens mesophilus TaxID=325473 RepID=UPI003D645907